jgi:hypothetical protein
MNDTYNLNSILNAIEEINTKKKKKAISLTLDNNNKIKEAISLTLDNNDKTKEDVLNIEGVLPITEKLILEAEEHAKKFKNNPLVLETSTEDVLILDKEYSEQNLEIYNLEEIKLNIIDDLYSSLSKKVKKNTLKVIFDLRKQINDLEKEIEVLKINKRDEDYTQDTYTSTLNENNEHLINEDNFKLNEEHLINEDNFELNEGHLSNEVENSLSEDTIKTLRSQNSLIKKFENNEEKLLLKIVSLEQDITLLGKKKINIGHNLASSEKNTDLDNLKSKTEYESIFYRENYERLVIENNDIKKKLINAKEQIIVFEKNIEELNSAFENLNNILSKNSIIKLSDTMKDSSIFLSSDQSSQISKPPSIHSIDKKKK